MSFFDRHSVCNLLRRKVLDSKPTVRQLFNLILGNAKNLSGIRESRWSSVIVLTPCSSPVCNASHFVMIPTVRLPAGSAARAIEKLAPISSFLQVQD
jgi:hypothetical protein